MQPVRLRLVDTALVLMVCIALLDQRLLVPEPRVMQNLSLCACHPAECMQGSRAALAQVGRTMRALVESEQSLLSTERLPDALQPDALQQVVSRMLVPASAECCAVTADGGTACSNRATRATPPADRVPIATVIAGTMAAKV